MLLRLRLYDLTIHHSPFIQVPDENVPIADALSRLSPEEHHPIADLDIQIPEVSTQFTTDLLLRIVQETAADHELCILKNIVFNGWPESRSEVLQLCLKYWNFRNEISIDNGILLKGSHIIIPKAIQPTILQQLHVVHQGTEKTKNRAHTAVYWYKLYKDIEDMTRQCPICQEHQASQIKEAMIPTDIPPRPWHTVGVDLFHLDGVEYLLIADYYSKFPFVRKLGSQTAFSVQLTSPPP